MKIFVFSLISVVSVLLVSLQHQQIGKLRATNASLQQSATEADQLRADLEKSAGVQAQDAAQQIEQLREENRDLLRLRGEVSQLNDAKMEFQKVSAENERLRGLVQNVAKPDSKAMKPIVIRMDSLSDHGHGTPEATVQTFFWAERDGSADELRRCVAPVRWTPMFDSISEQDRKRFFERVQHGLDQFISIEIVARKDLNSTTVMLGLQPRLRNGRQGPKIVLTLTLRDGDWKLQMDAPNDFYF